MGTGQSGRVIWQRVRTEQGMMKVVRKRGNLSGGFSIGYHVSLHVDTLSIFSSRSYFQGYMCSKFPWKTEISPSRTKGSLSSIIKIKSLLGDFPL